MYETLDDTIVAISSAAGHAPRGIVRLSGPDALVVADALFVPHEGPDVAQMPGFRRTPGAVRLAPSTVVPGEVYVFRTPHSYTRQDCVEMHTIGSPPVLAMLMNAALMAGARPAQPGEFTARAFLNGAIDLSHAQAVAATINARTDAQLRAARRLRDGYLTRRVKDWQDRLAELTALVEADIDFAEEPIEFVTPHVLKERMQSLAGEIEQLCKDSAAMERFDVLPTILLIGPPNAGKSSLLNALSGLDRAICSAIAGTTRDVLTAPIRVGPREALLLDAAGLHHDADSLMREAQAKARTAAGQVDLLCLVVDASHVPTAEPFASMQSAPATPCIAVANKIDVLDADAREKALDAWRGVTPANVTATVAVSAATGEGLDRLRREIADRLGGRDDLAEEREVVLSTRQRAGLESAADAVRRAIGEAAGLDETVDRGEILAFELRLALDALGSLVGEVTTEDLLTSVFSSFCIGK